MAFFVPLFRCSVRIFRALSTVLIFSLCTFSEITADSNTRIIKRRVLLLDFQNTSKNPNYDYLKESLSDNLKVELIKTGKFTVLDQRTLEKLKPNTSTEKLSAEEAGKLAEEVNCEAVVIGKFLATPKRIRINAQAIDAIAGELVIAEKADGEISSKVFETIDKVVIPLVSGMADKLPPLEEGKLKRKQEVEEKLAQSENGKAFSPNSSGSAVGTKSRTSIYSHITGGYFLPLGNGGNYFNNGFSGKASIAIQITTYIVPYISGGAFMYSGKTTLNNGYFYFANGGFSIPFNLNSKFTLMPYAAAGVFGGNLATSTSATRILIPVIDGGVYASYYFSESLGITLSASALYAMDKPDALLFTLMSAGIGLRF